MGRGGRVRCNGVGSALDEMRTQLAAFLENPEGYDRRRLMCDRIALAKACLAELDDVEKHDAERLELGAALKTIRLVVGAVTEPSD